MPEWLHVSWKKKSSKHAKEKTTSIPVLHSTGLAVAAPSSIASISQRNSADLSRAFLPSTSSVDSFDVTLDLAIGACKNVGDLLPDAIAGPIKGTFNIFISVLEAIKRCRDNREGWSLLAEIIIEKNKRVKPLLQLYAKAPADYPNALDQAMNYQRVLNIIAADMKKETEKPGETAQGLELYWSRMKSIGREAVLSNINAERISSYQDQLRAITLDIVEETVVRQALASTNTNQVANDNNRILRNIEMKFTEGSKPQALRNPKPRPRVVEGFMGRDDILGAMFRKHLEETSTDHDGPIMTILTGMGGSGKTQIAVKFASKFEEKFPGIPVYFLNASSNTSLESDLKTLVGTQTASYEETLTWLATVVSNWLLILDNADDPSLDLFKYIPPSRHGHIIITTRNETHKALAPRSTYVVDALPLGESITLLLRSSNCEDDEVNRSLAKDIVEELGRLPLAIAHAAAYICIHGRLGEYIETYRKSQSSFLNKQGHGYPRSVASTIQLSYDCLSPEAQQLLQLFSYLDIQSISRSIVERAAQQGFDHLPRRMGPPLNPNTIECTNVLRGLFYSDRKWSPSKFDEITEECLRYSLLRSTVVGEVYSMHPLVQTYLHLTSSSLQSPQKLASRLLASSITLDNYGQHFTFQRLLLPHIRLVALDDVTEVGDHYGFGEIFRVFGDELAISHFQRCLDICKTLLGDDHTDALLAMDRLASTYRSLGREQDALPLHEKVLEMRRNLDGPDHLNTITAMANLAVTYRISGRVQDALPLQEEVLEKRKKLSGPDDLETIRAMNNLAITYQSLGRENDALMLKEEVLEKWRKLLGPDHLDTITAMNNLSLSYHSLGRARDALPLQVEVLEKRKKLLGSLHRDTVQAICSLLNTYNSLKMNIELEELAKEALPLLEKVYGASHGWTVWVKKKVEGSQSRVA